MISTQFFNFNRSDFSLFKHLQNTQKVWTLDFLPLNNRMAIWTRKTPGFEKKLTAWQEPEVQCSKETFSHKRSDLKIKQTLARQTSVFVEEGWWYYFCAFHVHKLAFLFYLVSYL